MMSCRKLLAFCGCFFICTFLSTNVAQSAGVTVGSSTFFTDLDYGDTFTGTDDGGAAARPYIAAVQGPPAYVVEQKAVNAPAASFSGASFSFASDLQPTASRVCCWCKSLSYWDYKRKWSR